MRACLVARQVATNTSERAARKQTEQLDGAKRARAEAAKRICGAACASASTNPEARDSLERRLFRRLQSQEAQPAQDLTLQRFDEARRCQCTQCDLQLHSIAREG